jgi:hypothetical protein
MKNSRDAPLSRDERELLERLQAEASRPLKQAPDSLKKKIQDQMGYPEEKSKKPKERK